MHKHMHKHKHKHVHKTTVMKFTNHNSGSGPTNPFYQVNGDGVNDDVEIRKGRSP